MAHSKQIDCNACKKKIKSINYMECAMCNNLYDLDCLNITIENFNTYNQDFKNNWVCPDCKSTIPKSDNSQTPVRATFNETYVSGGHINLLRGGCRTITSTPREKCENPIMEELQKIREDLLDLRTYKDDMKLLRDEIQDLKRDLATSLEQQKEKYEEIIADNNFRFNTIKLDLQKNQEYLKEENKDLRDELKTMRNAYDDLEQRSRNCNLEIQNIPETKGENLLHTVEILGTIIGVPLPSSCITDVHRVAPRAGSERPKNIIVHLSTRRLRDDVVAACRSRRGLSLGQIRQAAMGPAGATKVKGSNASDDARRIYVNEHLTLKRKILYARTRSIAKELNYKYVWIKNATILTRKDDTTKIITIKCDEDLQKL